MKKTKLFCYCTKLSTLGPSNYPRLHTSAKIKISYYPMCKGNGALPTTYPILTRPILRTADKALQILTNLSHLKILPAIYDRIALDKAISHLDITQDEKESLLEYTQVYDFILELLNEVTSILSLYDEKVSIEEIQHMMAKQYHGFFRPSDWWRVIDNLNNVMSIEQDQLKWAKKSRNQQAPKLAECGMLVATLNGYSIGSIWVFSDPRMVSNDGAIHYIFAQGIRSSLPYILARMLRPTTLPLVSTVLIDAVESWAIEHRANAIRINPIENMYRILTKYHQFDSINPKQEMQISPFLRDVLEQKSIYNVIKYL